MKRFSLFIFLHLLLITISACEQSQISQRPSTTSASTTNTDDTDDSIEISRPSGAVYLQSACACKNGEAVSVNNCTAFCQSKNNTATTIYVETSVGVEIALSDLADIDGWCSDELVDPESGEVIESQNRCTAIFTDENFNTYTGFDVTTTAGSDEIAIEVGEQLDLDNNYLLQVQEIQSRATSDKVSFRLVSEILDSDSLGVLRITPVTQYSCMNVTVTPSSDGSTLYWEDISEILFYFKEEYRPDPLPDGLSNFYCQDPQSPLDKSDLPFIRETPGSFGLWSTKDPRFGDIITGYSGNGVMDVHDILVQKVTDRGGSISSTTEIFYPFSWPVGPSVSSSDTEVESSTVQASSIAKQLGYYMTTFIDSNTYRAFCPNYTHYDDTSNPLFQAIGDIVQVDTEAIYVAKKVGDDCTFMLIRESLLKQIWFYKSGSLHVFPTDSTVQDKKVQFYWPADTSSPHIKKSGQQSTYTILSIQELSSLSSCNASTTTDDSSAPTAASSSSGTQQTQSFEVHDKRVGCVPVISD